LLPHRIFGSKKISKDARGTLNSSVGGGATSTRRPDPPGRADEGAHTLEREKTTPPPVRGPADGGRKRNIPPKKQRPAGQNENQDGRFFVKKGKRTVHSLLV